MGDFFFKFWWLSQNIWTLRIKGSSFFLGSLSTTPNRKKSPVKIANMVILYRQVRMLTSVSLAWAGSQTNPSFSLLFSLVDFVDTYYNLTYKTLSMLYWAHYRMSDGRYLTNDWQNYVYVPGVVDVINGNNYFLNILDFDQGGYSNVTMIISWTFSNLKLIFIALTSLRDRT